MSNNPTTLNNSFESWSCNRCTYINSPKSTKYDMCESPCLTNSTNKYHQMTDSQNKYDITTSSTEPSSAYSTASASASIKSSSSTLEKNPISQQMLKQQDQLPLVWKCEVCTYENESIMSRCSICGKGQRPYTMTQMVFNNTSP